MLRYAACFQHTPRLVLVRSFMCAAITAPRFIGRRTPPRSLPLATLPSDVPVTTFLRFVIFFSMASRAH